MFRNIIFEVVLSFNKFLGSLDQYYSVAMLEMFVACTGLQSVKVCFVIPSKAAPESNPPFIAISYMVYFHLLLVSYDTFGKGAEG